MSARKEEPMNLNIKDPEAHRPGVEELLAIADRAAAHLKRPYADHARLLYDKNGLPK